MALIDLNLRTADRARKAELSVDDEQTGGDVIQAAVQNWTLPADSQYSITNVSKEPPVTIDPGTDLATAGVLPGETLEIQPVLVAGTA